MDKNFYRSFFLKTD